MSENKKGNSFPADLRVVLASTGFILAYVALIWLLGPRLAQVPHLPDQGAGWYFWKLPEPTMMGRITAWGGYLLHQLANFALIYRAKQLSLRSIEAGGIRYSNQLHKINIIALVVNAVFIILHLAQTHLWYDGLAQDTHVFSSLVSVAILLIWVLMMETPRRGLFFGVKVPIRTEVLDFAKKYHGYYFSWAIIYTFWFHPAEASLGHLWGFFYLLLIMLQGSLFFTRMHTNRYWTLLLEVLVLVHAFVVARLQGAGMWPMFAFGFGSIFVITQMHGLGWSRLKRAVILALYLLALFLVYRERGFSHVNEVFRIPVIDYLGVFILTVLFTGWLRVLKTFSHQKKVDH
ncbi:MAG: hypothetical protein K0U86_09435 [Planctomycetes bacterium]|nr:hypothetical protein [Planctomycetota bacterium]MCH9725112.1 hypothetical protein [Planctomycetota bacterium]MCH9774926.1 hypothetical protein [Planctomycetota bacterium]MCH9789329.1 hypothetical protein [Planctomycetota bacterium]